MLGEKHGVRVSFVFDLPEEAYRYVKARAEAEGKTPDEWMTERVVLLVAKEAEQGYESFLADSQS